MLVVNGKKYLSEKEASKLYGYSTSWFAKRRLKKLPPQFVRLENKGRTYYPSDELEEWFKENFK